jgi:hypothetical protein
MREILFKAKGTNSGEWVEGYYAHLNSEAGSRHAIIPENPEILNILMKGNAAYEIDRDTLSQYTGLKDSRGNMVWENDILEADYGEGLSDEATIYRVIFEDGRYMVENLSKDEDHDEIDDWVLKHSKVIGSYYDKTEGE